MRQHCRRLVVKSTVRRERLLTPSPYGFRAHVVADRERDSHKFGGLQPRGAVALGCEVGSR